MSIKKGDFVEVRGTVCRVIEKGNLNTNFLVGDINNNNKWTSSVKLIKGLNPIIASGNGSVDCIRKIKNKFERFVVLPFSNKDFLCYFSKDKVNISQNFTSKEDAIRWINFKYAFLKALENVRK
jgi:hypothetical protein